MICFNLITDKMYRKVSSIIMPRDRLNVSTIVKIHLLCYETELMNKCLVEVEKPTSLFAVNSQSM